MVKVNYDIETKEAEQVYNGIIPFMGASVKIIDQSGVDIAREKITGLKQALKIIEEKRKSIVVPLDTAKKNIQALFNPMKEKIDNAISLIECTIFDYKREKEEAIRVKEVEIAKSKPKDEVEELSQSLGLASVSAEKPQIKGGTVYYSAEVIDKSKLPAEYLIPDIQALNARARADKENFSIPGCKLIKIERLKG